MLDERFIQSKTSLRQYSFIHPDSLPSKVLGSTTADPRIGITASYHHPTNPALNNCLSAWRSPASMVTRLKGHIQGSGLCFAASILQSMDLGVRGTCFFVVALPHHLASLDHYRAHHGIGRSKSNTTSG
jgi:hypothetical protein